MMRGALRPGALATGWFSNDLDRRCSLTMEVAGKIIWLQDQQIHWRYVLKSYTCTQCISMLRPTANSAKKCGSAYESKDEGHKENGKGESDFQGFGINPERIKTGITEKYGISLHSYSYRTAQSNAERWVINEQRTKMLTMSAIVRYHLPG
ncbi:hypothetical protein FIBSPDRAFT_373949 [Athelia psychrophila]|uniref:Uncharacterized protein n=1 Tax=Athelia psychrophila TaxID=1759441 RepID=A0A166VY72_9AGAM|nr:hypothetical protein FIBSPDRAFT_373949 [Fibularhizoctonia sp. CBS 109695]